MNTEVKSLENSQVSLTVTVEGKVVQDAITQAYNEMKNEFNIQGFRKGKVPRPVIEKMYGKEVFFDSAVGILVNNTIEDAMDKENIDVAVTLRSEDIEVTEMTSEKIVYTATITVNPEVKLGEYKNLEVTVPAAEVTEEDINQAIAQEVEKNAREISVEGRTTQPQDKVTIDFEGFIDGVAFEGGAGTNHDLVLGSKSFIPGFEDQLIGKNIGDDVDVNVTFPEDYHADDLKGKPALFKVKIHAIKSRELPEVNDDFAADISEFDTLAEYKEDLKATLLKRKESERTREIESRVVEKASANATVEIPTAIIEEEVDRNIHQFGQRMQGQGLNLEQYMQFTGLDKEAFRDNFRKDAKEGVRTRLVFQAIVKAEGFEVSDEELDDEIKIIAEQYKMTVDQVKMSMGANMEELRTDLKVQKALDMLVETSTVVTE
ncbi:MAG: trigger factor [Epulopiscium sp. Nele67-Bin005]|nr:MAG: trigger factor [Epulopiscium sp. Nele67-Bin005]